MHKIKRELKFRVWDNEQKKFEYFELHNITVPERLLVQHKFPVQQYTGLQDYNGVDIYEGDILYFEKQEGVWTDQIGKCEVRFPYVCGNSHLGKIVGNIFEIPNY